MRCLTSWTGMRHCRPSLVAPVPQLWHDFACGLSYFRAGSVFFSQHCQFETVRFLHVQAGHAVHSVADALRAPAVVRQAGALGESRKHPVLCRLCEDRLQVGYWTKSSACCSCHCERAVTSRTLRNHNTPSWSCHCRHFGRRTKLWATFNEVNVQVFCSYVYGR